MNEDERNTMLMYDGTKEDVDEKKGPIQRRFSQKMSKWLKTSFFKKEICVLVSDLSGFTRLTRKYGVIHFASVIIRKRQLCLPILHKYGALFISTEADNFIVVMPSAVAGAKAANEMQNVIFEYNQTLPPEREHFKIILNGIGLDCGIGVVADREDKLHGEVSNTAYHIGEDLCSGGRVLCSGRMANRLTVEGLKADIITCEGIKVEQGAEGESVHEIKSIANAPTPDIVDTEDARFLHPNLMAFARRHNVKITEKEVIQTIDVEIKKHEKTYTALMFEFDMEALAMRSGAEATLTLKFQALDILRPVLSKFNAIALEDVLYVFTSPSDALAASLAARQTVENWNEDNRLNHKDELEITGFGMHTGKIIFVEGTDIHWGDPVNTSSKLGQDIAKDGIILISDKVKNGVDIEFSKEYGTTTKRSPFTKLNASHYQDDGSDTRVELNYVSQTVTVSKVALECFVVQASESIAIPLLNEEDTLEEYLQNEKNEKNQTNEKEMHQVILSENIEGIDKSWHPAQEAKKEEVQKQQHITIKAMTNPEVSLLISSKVPLTPANTPSKPEIPWLKTLSPKRQKKSRSPATSPGRRAAANAATSAYTQVPNIPFDDNGFWSKKKQKQNVNYFGAQNPSMKKNVQSKRRRPPKERESALTTKRQAMTLADEVLQDAEVQKIKNEAKQRKKAKQQWQKKLVSSTLYGSPTSKNMSKSKVIKRPGSPSKGGIKPRRPATSGSPRRRGMKGGRNMGGRGGGRGGRNVKVPVSPTTATQTADDTAIQNMRNSDMPILNENLFTQFLIERREAIMKNDDHNPTRNEAEFKRKANACRVKVLEAQMAADAVKMKMWSYDKSTDPAGARTIQIAIAKTQKILSRATKQAEKTHRAWLIEMTRNARSVTHADVDRQAPPQLPIEEMRNARLDVLKKRTEDAQEENRTAMNSYLHKLTRRQKIGDGGGDDIMASVSDPNIYLKRAKQQRILKEKQRRHEHDHGKNPHSPTLKRVGVQKKKNTMLYYPIGSQGLHDWSRRCSLKDAMVKFKDTSSAYALEYCQLKGLATLRTLNKDGMRGTYQLKKKKSTIVYLRPDPGWKGSNCYRGL